MAVVFALIPLLLIAILYIVIYVKLKSQKIPGEHSVNAEQQRQQTERWPLLLCWDLQYVGCPSPSGVSHCLCREHDNVLWRSKFYHCWQFYGSRKLRHKSLHLFYFQSKLSGRT